MAALQLRDVVEPLYPLLPGAPEATIVAAWRNAARKFFTETTAWRDETPAIGDTADDARYSITSALTDTEVFDVFGVYHDLTPLEKITYQQSLFRGYPTSGSPMGVRMQIPGILVVMPPHETSVASDLTMMAALRPTREATVIDDSTQQWHEAIEFGALEYALRIPNQPWSDFRLSSGYYERFLEQIDIYKHRGVDAQMRGVRRTVRYGGY